MFADTAFFVAILSRCDEQHQFATDLFRTTPARIITTSLVVVELGNFVCAGNGRRLLVPLLTKLEHDPRVQIVRVDEDLLAAAIKLYAQRPDKEWSLTDCASFVLMEDLSVQEALTGDHHFEQAGFTILMR